MKLKCDYTSYKWWMLNDLTGYTDRLYLGTPTKVNTTCHTKYFISIVRGKRIYVINGIPTTKEEFYKQFRDEPIRIMRKIFDDKD